MHKINEEKVYTIELKENEINAIIIGLGLYEKRTGGNSDYVNTSTKDNKPIDGKERRTASILLQEFQKINKGWTMLDLNTFNAINEVNKLESESLLKLNFLGILNDIKFALKENNIEKALVIVEENENATELEIDAIQEQIDYIDNKI